MPIPVVDVRGGRNLGGGTVLPDGVGVLREGGGGGWSWPLTSSAVASRRHLRKSCYSFGVDVVESEFVC